MELNFESDNVKGGDNTIKLKYYQIFYKVSRYTFFLRNWNSIDNSTNYLYYTDIYDSAK